jgi:DNA-binding transcriptional ArsR family regulator
MPTSSVRCVNPRAWQSFANWCAGPPDIATIAEAIPQDRSVIARHLQTLERAGVLHAQTEGRHTFYEIDGPGIASRMEKIVDLMRTLVPLCCAGPSR